MLKYQKYILNYHIFFKGNQNVFSKKRIKNKTKKDNAFILVLSQLIIFIFLASSIDSSIRAGITEIKHN